MTGRRTQTLETDFVDLVRQIFTSHGFQVESGIPEWLPKSTDVPQRQIQADIYLRSSTGVTGVAELKLFRSATVPLSTVTAAIDQTEKLRAISNAAKGVLVMLARVPERELGVSAERRPNVLVYDYGVLAFLTADAPDLRIALERLAQEAFTPPDNFQPTPTDVVRDFSPQGVVQQAPGGPLPPIRTTGADLCALIREVKPGLEEATEFEKRVEKAARYIWDKDLTAWAAQKRSERLSKYDLIARISSSHDIWKELSNFFKSRYVIFEFKNYTDEITQNQIYTTEKYLFPAALRSIAFTVSPKGADSNADHASRGALREQGKLIVNLTVDDICAMLHRKDGLEDHNSVLVDIIDKILMTSER